MQINTGIIFKLARKHDLPILKLLQITKKVYALTLACFKAFYWKEHVKISKAEKKVICSCPLKEMSHKRVAYPYQN